MLFLFVNNNLGVHLAKNHQLVRILYDTRPTHQDKLDNLALPSQRSFEIPLPHGTRATVQLLLPPSWREELRDAAFPVLVEVLVLQSIFFYIHICMIINEYILLIYSIFFSSNGKPGTVSILEDFRIDWGKYMSSHNDVVYIRIDVRGAKGQGKKALYRRLGGVEVQDQILVLK
jgi:hypothetical protein